MCGHCILFSEIKFPNDTVQLHPELMPFRPSPPRTQPPQVDDFDSDNDSFVGDDVDLADDPFVRSHSILQVSILKVLLMLAKIGFSAIMS